MIIAFFYVFIIKDEYICIVIAKKGALAKKGTIGNKGAVLKEGVIGEKGAIDKKNIRFHSKVK